MPHNQGRTSLRRRRHTADPMAEYDRLPRELREWLASAVLPWSATSARKAWVKALSKTNDPLRALDELDLLEAKLIAKDAASVWGQAYPVELRQAS